MKNLTKFLTVFLLALLGASNLWAGTSTTVYYAVDAATVGCYTVKYNANKKGDGDAWISGEMTKTSNTIGGKIVYKATFTDDYNGLGKLQFQLYDGSTWKSQQEPIGSWTAVANYNNKVYTHDVAGWETPSYDASYTIYFADYYGWGNDHGGVKAYAWNSDCDYNATWNGKAMTSTGKTYNGKTIYKIEIAKRYTKVKISAANHSDYATGDLDCYSNSGKICIYDGSAYKWVTYNYDVTITPSVNSSTMGGVTPSTAQTMLSGASSSFTATANTGYHFVSWSGINVTPTSSSNATQSFTSGSSNGTITATFAANTNTPYTVKHYKQNLDGTYPSTATETEDKTGTTDASVTPPTKSYTGFTAPSTQTKTIAADGSLVVEYYYTRNSHTLTWNANGGTIDGEATKVETLKYGAAITVPQTSSLSYSGHNFTGWNTTPASTMPDNDVTYTAQWEVAATATVTYDGNGNTGGTVPTDATTYAPGATVTVLTGTPEKTGYNFTGWKNSDGGAILSAGNQFTISSSVTLTAQWEIVNYSITYTGLEGATHSNPATYTVEDAFSFTAPTAREGYTFAGWSPASITKGTTGDITVTASWTLNHHTLTWNLDGGSITTPGTPAGEVDYGTTLVAPVVEKTGYTFAGWNPSVAATMPDNNVTYTAQWTENMTTVTVNANETTWGTVSGAVSSWGSTTTAGVATSKTLTAAAKTGYKFVNWELAGGATLSSGALTDAQITIKGDGSSTTGTAVATFAEDLSSTWHVFGPQGIFCPSEAWHCDDNNMMLRSAANSKDVTFTINITEEQKGKDHTFRIYNTSDSKSYGWGSNNDDKYVFDKTLTTEIYVNDHDLHFLPSITGEYTFTIADITATNPSLTVHFPSVNALNSNFSGSWGRTNGTVTDGVLTVEYNLQESEIKEGLEFEMIYEGTYYGPTEDGHSITPDSKDAWDLVAGQGHHVGFKPSIAGTYTFVFDSKTKKLTYTYPTLPSATTTTTEARYFGDDAMVNFIGGDGSENNPYLVYTDEKITITATMLEAQDHLTAMYQFGEDDASAEVLTKAVEVTSAEKQSIEVKAFYQVDGYDAKGETTAKTIYYQGVNKPSLSLTTSWNAHNDEAQEGVDVPDNVIVYYAAGNYSGPATVTRSKDGGDPVSFFTVESGDQKSETYALPDKNVQRQTFVATATVNGRTFTATKAISIYRLVEITITDATNLMDHYYMWENGTNPTREEEAWPGKSFFSTLGNAHIFYVKYPSYTHFVLNNGKGANEDGAIQTVNVTLPHQSTCYTIGEQITTEGDNYNKYNVQVAGECPNKLYVGDIAPVAALQGEGVMVSPQVDIDPLLDENDLVISFNYKGETGITCDQRGRSFMVTATSTGTKSISVTYSIDGAESSVTKDVTVNVTNAIMVQVKVPTSIEWTDHNDMWVYYFNHGLSAAHVRMSWKDYVVIDDKGYDRFTARVPLGGDEQVDFLFHEWTLDGEKPWLQTVDVQNVTASGCYTISVEQDDQSKKRKCTYDGGNCWTEYYVEIDMNNGTVYRSNKVEDLSQTVSFFAPDQDADQSKAGVVRIICNGTQKAIIPAATFDSSTVYTAKITANGEGLTDVTYYTGDYYIRTDGAEGGWNNYKQNSHKFTQFSLYNGAKYNHYWVANVKKETDSKILNIKACVGNEYNENLANMIESDNYTDGTGNIQVDGNGVNLRFGYNPQTNHFERAILKGAADNHFLNIQGDNIYNDEDCNDQVLNETNYNSHPEYSKFNDVSDWVYEKLIFVQIDNEHQSSSVLLKSKAFNGQILYQLGYTTDILGRSTSTPAQKVVMGAGSTNGKYTLRVIYDYKTNRLSATWEPSGEINEVKKVDSDILFVSNEGGEVKQITFGGDSATARLESLQSVMYVLEMENDYVTKADAPDAQYWIALPFECKISDIFGIENYITLDENRIAQSGWWGIMRYRGDLRAQKGWFIEDTPDGFWEWMYPTETLMPGEGYVLYVEKKSLSWNSITVEEPCEGTEDGCQDGKKSVQKYVKRFYFPSLVEGFTMNRSGEASSKVTYPNQPCNITSPVNRRAEDSNWKVIAPKSYNNVSIKSADEQDTEYALDGPNFIYTYNAAKDKGSRYTATATKDFEFKAFHGYMAQYGGTITWNPYSKTEHPTSAPRFAEEPNFKGGMLTIELVQNNEQLDRTFVNLSKNGTEGFDQNLDLTKITESCSQIASVSEDVLYAGSTLPLNIELVPLNVKVVANGTYDIALEQSLEGLEVRLYDAFEQTTTPLDLMSATVTLNKGEYKDRFYLQLKQKSGETPTSFEGKIEQYNLPTDKTQKLLINGNIYLINGGRIYNVLGVEE